MTTEPTTRDDQPTLLASDTDRELYEWPDGSWVVKARRSGFRVESLAPLFEAARDEYDSAAEARFVAEAMGRALAEFR